jgi:hypothetical protein
VDLGCRAHRVDAAMRKIATVDGIKDSREYLYYVLSQEYEVLVIKMAMRRFETYTVASESRHYSWI